MIECYAALFDRDKIADHPKFQLIKLRLPPLLESFHPITILQRVRNINDKTHKVIPVDGDTLLPMPFDALGLVAGCAELTHDLKYRIREPFGRNIATILN